MVASLGDSLGAWVAALSSPEKLIDTELVALGGGGLVLFVSEVVGPANSNEGQYSVRCLYSGDGGVTWQLRSTPVAGPRGVNIEDPRAVLLKDGLMVLAYEWEEHEGRPSEIRYLRSPDGGGSWGSGGRLLPEVVGDLEPGGFAEVGDELWFVASSDHEAPGGSYAGAKIVLIRSADLGRSWSRPEVVVSEPGQVSMGAIVLPSTVLMPSLREYTSLRRRSLAIYRVDSIGRWRVPCVEGAVFGDGFEQSTLRWSQAFPNSP